MSTATAKRFYTPEEYLELEVRSDRKHEYYRGEVFLMSGGTSEHSAVCINLYRLVGTFLAGRPCRLFDANMRVKVTANGLYTYPDASIACPPIDIEHKLGAQTLINPVALVEVLSPTTASYDRGEKFNLYREIDSLREYFLVSQDAPVVERRHRRSDGEWSVAVANSLESSIEIEGIGFTLQLAELYDKVEFPPRPEE